MALGGIYETGTVTIAGDRVSVTGVGTFWTPTVEIGDWLFVGGQVGLIGAIIDDTHLTLESQWQGTLPASAVYVIIKMSWLRYDPALTQSKVRELLEALHAQGTFLFVEGDEPDDAMGEDGQWALKTDVVPWQLWYKVDGVWVQQAPPAGIRWRGAWSSVLTYSAADGVQHLGSSYIAKAENTNQPPHLNADDWDLMAAKGDAGAAGPVGPASIAWKGAWNSATAYIVNDAVSDLGSSYVAIAGNINSRPPNANWNLLAQGIERLTGGRTYYVATTGIDTNDGRTAGTPFRTIQRAVDVVLRTLDCQGFDVEIKVADGTYNESVSVNGPLLNGGAFGLFIHGNATTAANCVISATDGDHALEAVNGALIRLGGFKLQTAGAGDCLSATFNATIISSWVGTLEFGPSAGSHFAANANANILWTTDYRITGSATSHWHSVNGGVIVIGGQVVTLVGTPNFSAYFCGVSHGLVSCNIVTFSGAATGLRFVCHVNGTIVAASRTQLPGDQPGRLDNGGVYADASDGAKYDPQVAWKAYTPGPPAPGAGSISAYTATGHYKLNGTVCHFRCTYTLTTVSGLANGSYVSLDLLPVSVVGSAGDPVVVFTGLNPDSGQALRGYCPSGISSAAFWDTAPNSGQRLVFSGSYEVSPTA